MKALTLAAVCLLSTRVLSQDVGGDGQVQFPATNPNPTIAPAPVQQNNQAVAPAVFYAPASGDKTVSPQAIEVEVPVYPAFQPKAQVQKIYTQIKDSQFFFEINPIRLKGQSEDFESNRMTVNSNPELEYENGTFKAKLMPLDFKFGFENEGWGAFAEVEIEDGDEASEMVVYAKVYSAKLGFGLAFSASDEEAKIRQDSVLTSKETMDTIGIAPYFYASFQLVNDDSMVIEQWNKIGGSYVKATTDGLTIKGLSFNFNPGLDIMFKINPKLQIGTGFEFAYSRFSGDIESGANTFSGVGNMFGFQLNLFQTRFIF